MEEEDGDEEDNDDDDEDNGGIFLGAASRDSPLLMLLAGLTFDAAGTCKEWEGKSRCLDVGGVGWRADNDEDDDGALGTDGDASATATAMDAEAKEEEAKLVGGPIARNLCWSISLAAAVIFGSSLKTLSYPI